METINVVPLQITCKRKKGSLIRLRFSWFDSRNDEMGFELKTLLSVWILDLCLEMKWDFIV